MIESAEAFHKRRIGQILSTLEEGEHSDALDYHRRKLAQVVDKINNPIKLAFCPIRGVYIKGR